MPSPFPGMDPYLEDPPRWPEVHGGLVWRIHEALNSQLPERYTAHVDRSVWLEEAGGQERVRDGVPDLYVEDRGTPSGGAVTLAAPRTVVLPLPTVRQERNRFVRIVDSERRRDVSVIELLSYSNKEPGTDREAYLLKRQEYLAMRVNLVEYDLLRSGNRMPLDQGDAAETGYLVLVCAATNFPDAGLWNFGVRDPIPAIPIPLDPADAPVMLHLKPLLDRANDAGRYGREIDYTQPPVPRLGDEDAAWAQQLLAARTTHQGASS
jgi:hypothetical protein